MSQHVLQFYVTQLARTVSYQTIKVYLAGLQFHSNVMGYQIQLSNMQLLYYVLRGIRRVQGSKCHRPRRPAITMHHLHQLLQFISTSSLHHHDQKMLWSAVTLAFFGFLRSSEYTSPSRSTYITNSTLLFSDVSISNNCTTAIIHIKSSKTDPFKTGCSINVGSTGSAVCPVRALFQFINVHRLLTGPLFMFRNGTYLTRRYMATLIQQALPQLPHANTHSFRIGGASAAASVGVPDSTIQILGRWSSDAYRRYLRLPNSTVCNLASRIANVGSVTRIWDTDSLTSAPVRHE